MADNSFGKSFRLLSANDFLFLRKGSKRVKSDWLLAYYKPKTSQENTRLGLSVSKKVGCAVVRNRTKRLLKESFRQSDWKSLEVDALFVVSPYLYKKNKSKSDAEKLLVQSFKTMLKEIGNEVVK